MNKISLIAMDMDGTLLDEDQRIPPENLAALTEAMAQGVHIAICSGRAPSDVSYYASDAGLDTCHILSLNGACCLDRPHGKPYALHLFSPDQAERISDVLLRYGVTFACFQQNRLIVVNEDTQNNPLNWGTYVTRDGQQAVGYGTQALAAHRGEGICKMVYIDEDRAPRIQQVRKALEPIAGIVVTSSWSNNLEIMPASINKGLALQGLANRLNIPAAQVMALGDYDNDLEMIQYAGWGIAMGNASASLKQVARHITLSNDQFGVAAAIRQYVL